MADVVNMAVLQAITGMTMPRVHMINDKKRKRSALGEGWDAEVDDDWDGWEPEEADETDDPMDIEEDTEDEGEDEGEEEEDDEKEDPTYIPKWDRG